MGLPGGFVQGNQQVYGFLRGINRGVADPDLEKAVPPANPGLKILRPSGLASSSLASGTMNIKAFSVSAESLFIWNSGHCARNCAQTVLQVIFLPLGGEH